jgi:primosomal replication protein N
MNDSFEVILNHDEFMKYKSIQKEYEKNCQVVLNLRHENENARLKCEQLEVTIRGHEFKIKELSKNSLRLSRRLLI